jgi:hypothetical protein
MKNWLGRVGSFIFGIVFGIIATIGGLIGIGFWGYKNLTINKVKELTKQDLEFLNAFLEQNAAINDMSIEQIVLGVLSIPDKTLDELSVEYGIKYPEGMTFLVEALEGVKINQIGSSMESVINGLKVGAVLGAPYNDYENYPPEYAGAAPENTTPLLWAVRDFYISELSEKITHEVRIGQLLGTPYDDFENTDSTPPEGAESFIWAIRGYTLSNMSGNMVNEVKIGSILGNPYSDYDNYPEDYEGPMPEGVDSLLWAIRHYTVNTMSNKLLYEIKVGKILGEPYSDFTAYSEDYEGPMPEGAEPLLWDLRTYTIKGDTGIGTYPDTLTVGDLKTVFNVTMPEILKIDDSVPIQNLGPSINNLYIYQIIDPPKEEADNITKNIINKIRFLKKDGSVQDPEEEPDGVQDSEEEPAGESDWYRLEEINELMNILPSSLTTQDVLENPSEQSEMGDISKVIMQKIYDGKFKVTELTQKIPETFNSTYLHELINPPAADDPFVTKSIINAIREMTYGGNEERYTLSSINELLKALPEYLTINSLIELPQEDSLAKTIIGKILATGAPLTQLSTELIQVFNNLTFNDILEAPLNSDSVSGRLINKLRAPISGNEYWKVTQIEEAINHFTFGDLFGTADEGILSLVDPATPLDEAPQAITDIILNTELWQLADKKVITLEQEEIQGTLDGQPIANMTILQIIQKLNDLAA